MLSGLPACYFSLALAGWAKKGLWQNYGCFSGGVTVVGSGVFQDTPDGQRPSLTPGSEGVCFAAPLEVRPLTSISFFVCLRFSFIDTSERNPRASASHWWYFWEESKHHHRQQPECRSNSAETCRLEAAVEPPNWGDRETPQAPGGVSPGTAVLLRCCWGWGLDEWAGALHDVRRESQGERLRCDTSLILIAWLQAGRWHNLICH